MFPSVACSSYFGYFVQFSRCGLISVEIRFKHLFSKCLNPTSTALVGPISDGTREVPRSKRFGTAKTLPQAEFTSAEDVKSCRDPILMPASKWVVGPSGLEPPTSRLSVVRSSQLSYGPVVVDAKSAPFVTSSRPSLTALSCVSSPEQTRFAGLCSGTRECTL